MAKYYRVRSQEQWDWLMKYFEKVDKGIRWDYSGEKPTEYNNWKKFKSNSYIALLGNVTLFYGDVKRDKLFDFIEVSKLMEDEKMAKYYRVRSQEQWDWLANKLNIYCVKSMACPVIIEHEEGQKDYQLIEYYGGFEPVIEVSQMMEDEKMENKNIANSTESSMPTGNKKIKDDSYVTISYSDLEKIKTSSGDAAFEWVEMEDESTKYDLKHVVDEIHIPKSLVQPKVKMTQAEKDEFDKVQRRRSATALLGALRYIDIDITPILFKRLFNNGSDPAKSSQAQNEFARAWADPSLIEVIPEKRWNVKIPPFEKTDRYYYKDGRELGWADSDDNDEEDQQFTADELKEYGLDDNMFEKVEVTDDGTK